MRRRDICVLMAFLLLALPACAQVFDLEKGQAQIVPLDGLWRFHTGDDPKWAQPSFDDSNWALLRSDVPWSAQGYSDYSGFVWYRFTIRVPAAMREPALLMPGFQASYQVFADGRMVGELGGMPPHPRSVWAPYKLVTLPRAATDSPRSIVIAIRGWNWVRGHGGPNGLARAGSVDEVRNWASILDLRSFWENTSLSALTLIYVMGGLGSLLLFAFRRTEREYLWFAIYELANALSCITPLAPSFGPTWSPLFYILSWVSSTASDFALIFFVASLLRVGRQRALWVAAGAAGCTSLLYLSYPALDSLLPAGFPPGVFGILEMLEDAGQLIFNIGILYVIFQAMRRHVTDARLLFYPILLYRGVLMLSLAAPAISNFGFHKLAVHIEGLFAITSWPFPIGLDHVLEFLTQGAILAILVLRFARSRRDEERMTSEIEAARLVQKILVPNETPSIPGFQIETVYLPAGQVGGDFFQIFPTDNGGALIAIGDVSGKGMPAAMTVSLLVGTVRTLAHYTHNPAEILDAMNQRMLTRNHGGFTTCLVLRFDPDGTIVAANAGHLSPYCNGREVSIDGGLPLGLDGNAVYGESKFETAAGTQVTLVTDGVVEARAKDGELFGFERSLAISKQSARDIAEAAVAFGQEDDVTVLTVSRIALPSL